MLSSEDLARYSLFGGLAPGTIEWLRERLEILEVAVGDTVVRQGVPGDRVFFIERGLVSIQVDGVAITELHEGEQFGEMYLIDVQPRSATVIARQPCLFLALRNQIFLQLRQWNQDAFVVLLMNCARDISRRLRISNRRLAQALS